MKKNLLLCCILALFLLVSCQNAESTKTVSKDNSADDYYTMAEKFVTDGNYESAISVLQEGISKTDSAKLQNYLNEITAEYEKSKIQPPYEISDGYYLVDAMYVDCLDDIDSLQSYAVLIDEKNGQQMYFNESSGEVAVLDTETDVVFLSNGLCRSYWDRESELLSQFLIETKEGKVYNTYDHSASYGKITSSVSDGALTVTYEIGDFMKKDQYLVPIIIEKSRFEERILEPMKESVEEPDYWKRFESYYLLKDPNADDLTETEKHTMYNTYPITKEMAVYVIDPGIAHVERELRMFEKLIKEHTDYTYEDMYKDHCQTGYMVPLTHEGLPALYTVSVRYTLTDEGLVAELVESPEASIDGNYPIEEIQVLPYASVHGNESTYEYVDIGDGSVEVTEIPAKGDCEIIKTYNGIKAVFKRNN